MLTGELKIAALSYRDAHTQKKRYSLSMKCVLSLW